MAINYDPNVLHQRLLEMGTSFHKACEKLGLPAETMQTLGGSDNNILVQHGISGIVLSCGMYNVHSTGEYSRMEDLIKSAQLVAELLVEEEIHTQ